MLLYQHPVNDAREARRLPALNSLWLDGVGAWPPDFAAPEVQVLPDLQQAAERADVAAWRAAWLRIEAEQVPQWSAALDAGEALELHLCGLQQSAVFTPAARSLGASLIRSWQRWRQPQQGVHWPSALA